VTADVLAVQFKVTEGGIEDLTTAVTFVAGCGEGINPLIAMSVGYVSGAPLTSVVIVLVEVLTLKILFAKFAVTS
jgi:hypothetical protein